MSVALAYFLDGPLRDKTRQVPAPAPPTWRVHVPQKIDPAWAEMLPLQVVTYVRLGQRNVAPFDHLYACEWRP